jgi:lambda repressor-like predicted transcriptional regulator
MPKKQRLSNTQLLEINRLADKGMSQKSIAGTLGISKQAVSRELNTDWTVERLVAEAGEPAPAVLMPHETQALKNMLAEMAAGPGFTKRWNPLDMQTVVLALRRVSGMDDDAAPAA